MSKAKCIHALDLGSGFAKHTVRKGSAVGFMAWPSLAPRHTGRDLSMSILGKRNTVVVTVDGTEYEVGPDSADLDTQDTTRNLNEMFIYSNQYRAVYLGALAYMGDTEIDLLVVGLPLTTIHRAPELKKLMEGTHKVNDSLTVTVKEALVLPQPMGGFYYCLSQADKVPEFEYLRDDTNLIIDPGYLTFDFLTTNGDKINDTRSNAHPGGVSKVLRAIAESISNKFEIKYDNLSAIDKALARRKLKISGKPESLDEHIRYAKPAIEGSVNFMRNLAGDGSDIDNIILLGGGHGIFQRTIANYYRDHEILVLSDAQLANVKGFLAAGEAHLGQAPCPREQEETLTLQKVKFVPPAPVQAAATTPPALDTAEI